ncbi:MAG: TonB family protein [Pyrinomonadaceae bacterium]
MHVVQKPVARSLSLLLLLISLVASVTAQQPAPATGRDTSQAIELYRRGDANQAITKLTAIVKKRPDDAEAWDVLATVLQQEGMIGRARTALEKLVSLRPEAADAHARLAYALILADERAKAISTAVRALELGDQSPEAHYAIAEANFRGGEFTKSLAEAEAALSLKPDFLPALITKSLAHSSLQQYPEAVISLERFLALSPNDIDAETWRSQLEELSLRANEMQLRQSVAQSSIFTGKQVTERARVTYKPEPQYTEQARIAGVTGTVILRAVFSAEGEVKRVFVMRAVGYGLSTQAVKAARLIKFTPAKKDGEPVSMFVQLEYNFNLY